MCEHSRRYKHLIVIWMRSIVWRSLSHPRGLLQVVADWSSTITMNQRIIILLMTRHACVYSIMKSSILSSQHIRSVSRYGTLAMDVCRMFTVIFRRRTLLASVLMSERGSSSLVTNAAESTVSMWRMVLRWKSSRNQRSSVTRRRKIYRAWYTGETRRITLLLLLGTRCWDYMTIVTQNARDNSVISWKDILMLSIMLISDLTIRLRPQPQMMAICFFITIILIV